MATFFVLRPSLTPVNRGSSHISGGK
jgi:hypothetical protein